jgi:hypothetical protein
MKASQRIAKNCRRQLTILTAERTRKEWLHQANTFFCNLGIVVTTMTQTVGPMAGLCVFVVWDTKLGIKHFNSQTLCEAWLDARYIMLTGQYDDMPDGTDVAEMMAEEGRSS